MKLVCVHGSPREAGNSSKIADRLCALIQAKGHLIKSYYLNRLKYIGCQSCMGCKGKSEICVLKDDLTEVLSEVKSADVIVLASPIFFGDLSAQMKGFIDRTYSYLTTDYKSRLLPGKKLIMILAQGDPDKKHFADVFPRYNEFFKWHDVKESHLIRAFYSTGSESTPLDHAYRDADEIAAKINR